MCRILIFGGTTEGRELASFCVREKISAWISVVSDYGKELLEDSPFLHVKTERMDESDMVNFLSAQKIELVIDATHPYAKEVTKNIRTACEKTDVTYIRCLRKSEDVKSREPEKELQDGQNSVPEILCFSSVSEVISYLETRTGAVLLTTGSKELSAFRQIKDFEERVFARVLPSFFSLKKCEEAGLKNSHIICMQGPFSEEMNRATLTMTKAAFLVTKESGAAGGYLEKLKAAADCQVKVLVIRRPDEDGADLKQCFAAIKEIKIKKTEIKETEKEIKETAEKTERKEKNREKTEPELKLIGIGPGSLDNMTAAAVRMISESEVWMGASRILDAAENVLKEKGKIRENPKNNENRSPKETEFRSVWNQIEKVPVYTPEKIFQWLKEHPQYRNIAVLFSGDTGFYSGAAQLAEACRKKQIPFQMVPGISSVSYLASRLGVSYEDAATLTAHGRIFDLEMAVTGGMRKMFLLLGGEQDGAAFCRTLCRMGHSDAEVGFGERLSYEDERILRGKAADFTETAFHSLSVMYIQLKSDKEKEE